MAVLQGGGAARLILELTASCHDLNVIDRRRSALAAPLVGPAAIAMARRAVAAVAMRREPGA
jgi:hypothetical protein